MIVSRKQKSTEAMQNSKTTIVTKIKMPLGDSRKSQNEFLLKKPEQKAFLCQKRNHKYAFLNKNHFICKGFKILH